MASPHRAALSLYLCNARMGCYGIWRDLAGHHELWNLISESVLKNLREISSNPRRKLVIWMPSPTESKNNQTRQSLPNLPTEYRTYLSDCSLTLWGRVTHICVGKLTIIGSDNGLSPERRQAIIWTNAGILLIGPLRTNFSEILIEIQTFSFKKMHLKMSSAKWRPFVSASMC